MTLQKNWNRRAWIGLCLVQGLLLPGTALLLQQATTPVFAARKYYPPGVQAETENTAPATPHYGHTQRHRYRRAPRPKTWKDNVSEAFERGAYYQAQLYLNREIQKESNLTSQSALEKNLVLGRVLWHLGENKRAYEKIQWVKDRANPNSKLHGESWLVLGQLTVEEDLRQARFGGGTDPKEWAVPTLYFQEADRILPNSDPRAKAGLFRIAVAKHQWDQADLLWRQIRAKASKYPDVQVARADWFLEKQHYQDATKTGFDLKRYTSYHYKSYEILGLAALGQQKWDDALIHSQRGQDHLPANPVFPWVRAQAYLGKGNKSDALDYLASIIPQYPRAPFLLTLWFNQTDQPLAKNHQLPIITMPTAPKRSPYQQQTQRLLTGLVDSIALPESDTHPDFDIALDYRIRLLEQLNESREYKKAVNLGLPLIPQIPAKLWNTDNHQVLELARLVGTARYHQGLDMSHTDDTTTPLFQSLIHHRMNDYQNAADAKENLPSASTYWQWVTIHHIWFPQHPLPKIPPADKLDFTIHGSAIPALVASSAQQEQWPEYRDWTLSHLESDPRYVIQTLEHLTLLQCWKQALEISRALEKQYPDHPSYSTWTTTYKTNMKHQVSITRGLDDLNLDSDPAVVTPLLIQGWRLCRQNPKFYELLEDAADDRGDWTQAYNLQRLLGEVSSSKWRRKRWARRAEKTQKKHPFLQKTST